MPGDDNFQARTWGNGRISGDAINGENLTDLEVRVGQAFAEIPTQAELDTALESVQLTEDLDTSGNAASVESRAAGDGRIALPRSIMPPGVKLRGVNVVPTYLGLGISGAMGWGGFWQKFPWETSIKPQIEIAIAEGANAIRFMGGLSAITDTPTGAPNARVALATYLERMEQVVAYCQQRGLMVIPAAEAYGHRDHDTQTDEECIEYIAATVEMLGRYSNVIGVDLSNELLGEYSATHSESPGDVIDEVADIAEAIYDAVKPTTHLPLTFSHSYDPIANASWFNALNPFTDYIDLHMYPYAWAPTTELQIDSVMAANAGKPIIASEYGDEQNPAHPTYYSAGRTATHFALMRNLWGRPGFDGGCVFSAVDIVPPSVDPDSHATGLYEDETMATPRADMLAGFRAMPARAQAWPYYIETGSNVSINANLVQVHEQAIYCARPGTVEVDLLFDMALPGGGDTTIYGVRSSLNGSSSAAAVGGVTSRATIKNEGSAASRLSVRKVTTFRVGPGTQTFRSFVERITGSGTSASVVAPSSMTLRYSAD